MTVRGHVWGERGYALVFALGVMLVVLAFGVRFMAVAHSRHLITDNEKAAIQATMIADAGLQRVARELGQDMSWSGAFSSVPFAGGTYSTWIIGRNAEYVVAQTEGTFGTVTRGRYGLIYTPASSGVVHLWGSTYGLGLNEWDARENLFDSAEGETGTYAFHRLGEGKDQMSFAGFGSDVRAAAISKVEIVISGYVDTAPVDDYLSVRWRLTSSGTGGDWHVWSNDVLDDYVYVVKTGRIYLDVTDDAPPGGWRWEHFFHGTDLELRFASYRVGLDDRVDLYVDCAGFRVTWGP